MLAAASLVAAMTIPGVVSALEYDEGLLVFGFKVSVGGRYDRVRMCVATPPGTGGGPSLDISFFAEIGIARDVSVTVDIPVMRPLLFASAFKMLQFEPSVTLNFRQEMAGKADFVVGPSLGVILHYGQDFESGRTEPGRTDSFFAMGPRIGLFVGIDFKRPGELFNFLLGFHPYMAPLWGVNDPAGHHGAVLGGNLEMQFRFDGKKE